MRPPRKATGSRSIAPCWSSRKRRGAGAPRENPNLAAPLADPLARPGRLGGALIVVHVVALALCVGAGIALAALQNPQLLSRAGAVVALDLRLLSRPLFLLAAFLRFRLALAVLGFL